MSLFIVAAYLGAGWLVLRRVREHWGAESWAVTAVVVGLWPVVVTGVEVLWLVGVNDWHLR